MRQHRCAQHCGNVSRVPTRGSPDQPAFRPWIGKGLIAEPGEPPPITDVPLSSHITTCPLVVLYQRMSLLPSPLKSPVWATAHGLATEPGEPPPITLAPLNNQMTACPVLMLYQRMSLLPS